MVSSIKSATYKQVHNTPIQNPVIEGYFPRHNSVRELALFRFNRFLSFSLALTILVSMVSYSMVVAKENAIISVHNKTNDMNLENVELQNKVDYARSFYNVNYKISQINFLKKPDKIIEVKANTIAPVIDTNNKQEVKPVSGY